MSGRREKAGLLLGEDLRYCSLFVAGPAPPVRHLIAPDQSLAVAFGQPNKEMIEVPETKTLMTGIHSANDKLREAEFFFMRSAA
jgi:hypothetical protein